MKRRRNREINVFGTSFLDVFANTIGGLAFLLVMAVLTAGGGSEKHEQLRLTTTKLLPAGQNQDYPAQLAAEGGNGYYRWQIVAGAVPGLRLSSDGSFVGQPSTRGDFPLTVMVKDQADATASRELTLSVEAAHFDPKPIQVKTVRLADAISGRAYGMQLAAEGGVPPYSWQASEIGHPAWLKTGQGGNIQGTPDKPDDLQLRWQVSDSRGMTATSQALTLTVLPPVKPVTPLVLRTRAVPRGRVGDPYEATLAAFGGAPPYQWTAEGMPPGLQVSDDRVVGTPIRLGDYQLSVTVRDSEGHQQNGSVNVNVEPKIDPPKVMTRITPEGVTGTNYALALAGEGGIAPYSWRIVKGELPPGLKLDGSSITGVPQQSGDSEVGLMLRDARGGEAAGTLPMKMLTAERRERLRVQTQSLPLAVGGTSYRVVLSATGGQPPYRWAASGLPEGLRVENDVLVGYAAQQGEFSVTLTANDGSQRASASMVLESKRMVNLWMVVLLVACLAIALLLAARLFVRHRSNIGAIARFEEQNQKLREQVAEHAQQLPPLELLTAVLPNGRASCEYNVQLACQGGMMPYRWQIVDGELPPGLTLEPDGLIHGKPFEGVGIDDTRELEFVVEVADATGQTARKTL
jgi:uncharacterized membrane protein YciS (DUF1049 family)